MSNELNPCPYCGGAGAQIDTRVDELSYVVCSCCGAFGPSGIGADGAIAAWNHRVPAERLVDVNKSSQPNQPLTLEELRGMGGEPVYIVFDDKSMTCALVDDCHADLKLTTHWGGQIVLATHKAHIKAIYRHKPEED